MSDLAPKFIQMPDGMRVDSFGGTHQGRIRPINEDRFLCRPDAGVWLVADGMGGHSHGDIASSAIVQSVGDATVPGRYEKTVDTFTSGVFGAHEQIKEISRANGGLVIGSTVAGLVMSAYRFSVIWSGDSRVYLVRDTRVRQLTTDHTEAQALLRKGAITQQEAENWPRRNVIVHAVGVDDAPHIEMTRGETRPGDMFVLCTDGLTNHVADEEIQILTASNTAQRACVELIRVALERGGKDNVSVVVVRCLDPFD
jgi:serine/threonine protein phosphatase PrpC